MNLISMVETITPEITIDFAYLGRLIHNNIQIFCDNIQTVINKYIQ